MFFHFLCTIKLNKKGLNDANSEKKPQFRVKMIFHQLVQTLEKSINGANRLLRSKWRQLAPEED